MKKTMDGRLAGVFTSALLLCGAGCVTSSSDKLSAPGTPPPNAPVVAARPSNKKPGPAVALEFAKLRRDQATNAKADPETQRQLLDVARGAYLEALKAEPGNFEAMRGVAQIYVLQNDYDRAFDAYRKAQAKHPKSAELYLDLAMVHNRRREWTEAQNSCRKAVELEPENRQAQTLYGMTLARAGQYDQALPYLSRASGPAMAHYNIARMQVHMGQTDQARNQLALALRDNPDLQQAQELVARLDSGNAVPGTGTGNNGIVQTGATVPFRATP